MGRRVYRSCAKRMQRQGPIPVPASIPLRRRRGNRSKHSDSTLFGLDSGDDSNEDSPSNCHSDSRQGSSSTGALVGPSSTLPSHARLANGGAKWNEARQFPINEGKYTTNIKRGRFCVNSTPQDDKLASCERLRCHEHPSSSRSMRSGVNKRRRTLMEDADNEDAQSSMDGSAVSGTSSNDTIRDDSAPAQRPKRARRSKSNSISSKVGADKISKGDNDIAMNVDSSDDSKIQSQVKIPATPKSPPRSYSKSRFSGSGPKTPGTGITTKAKSPLGLSFTPPSPPAEDDAPPQADKEKTPSTLPRAVVEITTERDGSPRLANPASRKSSNISLREACKGDDAAQTDKEKPKSKSRARKSAAVYGATPTPKSRSKKVATADSTTESTSTATRSKATKPKSSSGALKPKSSVASLKTKTNVKPTSSTGTASSAQKLQSKAGSVGRRRGKVLTEVVGTSVEGEGNL